MEGGRWPHLADAGDIQQWAEYRAEPRNEFPRLIRRLISQTNDQVVRLEMRSGKGTDVKGYDGIVEAAQATPFVPSGLSVWELGTGGDPQDKANSDYRERSKDPLDIDMSTTTFVVATPREWKDKDAWAARRREEGKWRDVRAFDVADVELALESAPAAHLWLSEILGKPATGVRTIENWWEAFSSLSQPALTPELVLAGRADQAAELLRLIEEEQRLTKISAASTDEVLAFVAGTLLTTSEEQRADLLARTLIVHDVASLRMLETASRLLILLPFDEALRRAAELVRGHHVIFLAPADTPSDIVLPGVDRDEFSSGLEAIGVGEEPARRLAAAAHRSIVAFQRDPEAGAQTLREWASDLEISVARRAWLAGSWNERRSGDVEAMTMLLGTSYEEAREQLKRLAQGEDPLFTVVGGTWALVSVEEAWRYGVARLDDFDLSVLETTIQTVLGAVDPGLELPVEERWTANLYGKSRIHSADLRRGLATTLAIAGARGRDVRLTSIARLSDWVDNVVYQLLDRSNDDSSGQLWASLSDVLPQLAEAAPDVFLRAIQKGVAGENPVLKDMFADAAVTDTFSVSSPHTELLWALETLAWSEEYGPLAIDLLARLAEIDPGGKLSNRPANSLADIFRTWLPQTSLAMERRLSVLSSLQRNHPDVAWPLMLTLLPEAHAVGRYTRAPRFRSWKPEKQGVTNKEYWDFSSATAMRLMETADAEPSRWIELVEHVPDFPPPERSTALQKLSALADEEPDDEA